jgi:hypothetical protein
VMSLPDKKSGMEPRKKHHRWAAPAVKTAATILDRVLAIKNVYPCELRLLTNAPSLPGLCCGKVWAEGLAQRRKDAKGRTIRSHCGSVCACWTHRDAGECVGVYNAIQAE